MNAVEIGSHLNTFDKQEIGMWDEAAMLRGASRLTSLNKSRIAIHCQFVSANLYLICLLSASSINLQLVDIRPKIMWRQLYLKGFIEQFCPQKLWSRSVKFI